MADIYKKNKILPQNLPEILTPVDNVQAIIIEKEVYGAKGFRDTLDTDFSELNKPKKQNVDKFFRDYEELFYDVPDEGKEKSHRYILEKSGEYLDIFESRDNEIDRLEDQIEELQERIDELENPEEHPFYPNGTVLSAEKGGSYYYMERGKKRNIVGGRPGQVWATLKVALGYKESDDDYEMNIVKATPRRVLSQIDSGPSLDLEDIGGGKQESIQQVRVRLDPSDWRANPDRYNNLKDYSVALEKEIVQAWDLERAMESLYNKYNNDRKNAYTAEEREQAKEDRNLALEELEAARRKLAAYKMIYQKLQNDEDVTIDGITKMYDDLTKNDFEDIPDRFINQFEGWEKGKGDLRSVVGKYWKEGQRGTEKTIY